MAKYQKTVVQETSIDTDDVQGSFQSTGSGNVVMIMLTDNTNDRQSIIPVSYRLAQLVEDGTITSTQRNTFVNVWKKIRDRALVDNGYTEVV